MKKLGILPQEAPIPTSQIAQDVLDQTDIVYQDVCRNPMQAYIKHEAYCDKNANALKLKEAVYLYALQSKTNHRGSKVLITDFGWIGPYLIEKLLPNNIYLIRQSGTNKTHVPHGMQKRQFQSPTAPTFYRYHATRMET